MNIRNISIATYQFVAHDDAFACTQTVMLEERWPISIGTHPLYPGKRILIGHVQDRAFLAELDDEGDPDPAEVERMLTINLKALQ
jgi:hypothetical protein